MGVSPYLIDSSRLTISYRFDIRVIFRINALTWALGTDSREQGTENREQGTGNRVQSPEFRAQGTEPSVMVRSRTSLLKERNPAWAGNGAQGAAFSWRCPETEKLCREDRALLLQVRRRKEQRQEKSEGWTVRRSWRGSEEAVR